MSSKHFDIISLVLLSMLLFGTGGYALPTTSVPFSVVSDGNAVEMMIDSDDFEVVRIAAEAVCGDIEMITGIRPNITDTIRSVSVIVVGTYGYNDRISQLAKSGKLDCSHINDGQWESYLITVVDKPFKGIDRALVIAGSDRRGTAYGLFQLSETFGVSPWVYWADIIPKKRKSLSIPAGFKKYGPPSVKYRGIFINDEKWGLHVWAARHKDQKLRAIGPNTYAEVFELLLRLKANYIWPAMFPTSTTFYSLEENKKVADDYAIVIGSSHCEPLLFNNLSKKEWDIEKDGPWNYLTNAEHIYEKLDRRVEFAASNENTYTLALRGIGDQKMREKISEKEKVKLIEKVLSDQRQILTRHIDRPIEEVPQTFVLYNEVLDHYRRGMILPDDITLIWVDDNLESIRHFSGEAERKRSGGSGVYYRISYLGGTHGHYWLNSVPPAQICKEMTRAYETGSDRLWVLNSGDIKPGELGVELFVQMAWNINRWTVKNIQNYLKEIALRDFGPEHADQIAALLGEYFRLTTFRRPEHTEHLWYPDDRSKKLNNTWRYTYTYWTNGDEAHRQIDAYNQLVRKAQTVKGNLPARLQDAYYQLVLYPIIAATNKHNYEVYACLAEQYAKEGRQSAWICKERSQQAKATVHKVTSHYNNKLADGKWKGIMPISTGFKRKYELKFPDDTEGKTFGIAVEGKWGTLNSGKAAALPQFNRYTRRKYFIDIFNYGIDEVKWNAAANKDWIQLSTTSGILGRQDNRIWVDVDYDTLSEDDIHTGKIIISDSKHSYSIDVEVYNVKLPVVKGDFIKDNGIISIEPDHWSNNNPSNDRQWKIFESLGRKGKAVGLLPITGWYIEDISTVKQQAPVLEYSIYTDIDAQAVVEVWIKEGFGLDYKKPLRCAVSIDDAEPVWVEFLMGRCSKWMAHVNQFGRNAYARMNKGQINLEIPQGRHSFKVWGTDPSIILEHIVIDFDDLPETYLAPHETIVRDADN